MMRILTAFLVSVLLNATSASSQDWRGIIEDVRASVATLYIYDSEQRRIGVGTGFFVSEEGDLVTNWHVIRRGTHVEAVLSDRKMFPVRYVLAEDPRRDLVLVRVELDQLRVPALQLESDRPEPGTPVLVIGSPLGLEQTVSDGLVSGLHHDSEWGTILQFTAPVSAGSSGSPVVTREGRVLGIVTFQFREAQNLNFAVSSSSIIALERSDPVSLVAWSQRQPQTVGMRRLEPGVSESASADRPHNPWTVHRNAAGIAFLGTWGATVLGSLAMEDYTAGTTIIPVFGPWVSMARIEADPELVYQPGGKGLLTVAGILQGATFAYLAIAWLSEMQHDSGISFHPSGTGGFSLDYTFRW